MKQEIKTYFLNTGTKCNNYRQTSENIRYDTTKQVSSPKLPQRKSERAQMSKFMIQIRYLKIKQIQIQLTARNNLTH